MSLIAQTQKENPKCKAIIGLIAHLHQDCAEPEIAAIGSLKWLAAIAQNQTKSPTALVFEGVQGAGKTILFEHILKPIFGAENCETYENYLDNDLKHINLIDCFNFAENGNHLKAIISSPRIWKNRENVKNAHNFIVATQQAPRDPSNRRLLIAKCKQAIQQEQLDELSNEIEQGGLFGFADLLHQIKCAKDNPPPALLNSIY